MPSFTDEIKLIDTLAYIHGDTNAAFLEASLRSDKIVKERLLKGEISNPFPAIKQLPYGVRSIEDMPTHKAYRVGRCEKYQGLLVSASIAHYEDKSWYHVCLSREARMPSYADMAWVKRHWIGEERSAFQLFPKAAEHVNIHSRALHLWSCLDEFYIPDFRMDGQI